MATDQKKEEIDLSNGILIGHGSFGEVYRLSDGNGAFVLKIPWRPKDAQAFEQECRTLAQIEHPNVVTYFRVVDVNDNRRMKLGIKMEFCERGSLQGLIFNPTIIYSMTNISTWAEQLSGALAFIFDEHRIIHHDIKAENIFVAADFSLKLGDFGLLKESHGTRSGTFDRGTERYRSPPEIQDPKKPNETSPKLSHKNDVYSMGLVLWELVERRVVLSEFDAYGGGFDYHGFCWTVYLQKLSHVAGPTCSGPMRDIVQKCTRFERRKRPEASDILEQIKALTQANGDLNQVTPIENPNENRLIRPIGFNGDTDQQPIDASLHPESSQDARMAEGAEIVQKYMNRWRWKERVDSFVHQFNSLNPEKRSEFVHNIPNLVAKALENKKIHFHEAQSHLTRLGQDKSWKNHPLGDLFQVIIELNQRQTERDIALELGSYIDGNALPWIKSFDYSGLIKDLEQHGSKLRSTTFYFRAFLSTETLQVWLLLMDDDQLGVLFIRKDFQLELRKGKWMSQEKSKCRVGNDDLNYLEDREIDFHQILKKTKAQEKLLNFQAKNFLDQLAPLEESQQRTESISVPNIGSDLPVQNYLFQLRNPPRMDCRHHPKCPIWKYSGRWKGEPKEMDIPYYSCSSHEALQYLGEWWEFCRDYLKDSLLLSLSDRRKITSNSFIFIQFKRDNQYYTLLDHPNNYEDHELIYFFDKRDKRFDLMESYCYDGLYLRRVESELHKLDKVESSKICQLLDEMAPEMRRYAVMTKGEIFTLDLWRLLAFQARILLNQLVPLEESQQRTESISVPLIGSDLIVKNYLFQLRNPPRMHCRHHPKCHILKYSGRWRKPKEMGIPYYSCSTHASLRCFDPPRMDCKHDPKGSILKYTDRFDSVLREEQEELSIPYYSSCSHWTPQYLFKGYLEEWWAFCRLYLSQGYPLSPSDQGETWADSLIFIQFKRDNQYYTLLDHPNNYEDHELIYYYDATMELHKMESSKIRKLLDEMAPEMRRYAVVTGSEIFTIDQAGNRLPWSVSE